MIQEHKDYKNKHSITGIECLTIAKWKHFKKEVIELVGYDKTNDGYLLMLLDIGIESINRTKRIIRDKK